MLAGIRYVYIYISLFLSSFLFPVFFVLGESEDRPVDVDSPVEHVGDHFDFSLCSGDFLRAGHFGGTAKEEGHFAFWLLRRTMEVFAWVADFDVSQMCFMTTPLEQWHTEIRIEIHSRI